MLPTVFWTFLLATCGFAFWRGRSDERAAAAVCLAATLATKFAIPPQNIRYEYVATGLVAIDVMVCGAFIFIALRSDRFWPLWVAGLQLTGSLAHVMKTIQFDLMPQVYAAAAAFWSYPILLIIMVGTWRSHRRQQFERLQR